MKRISIVLFLNIFFISCDLDYSIWMITIEKGKLRNTIANIKKIGLAINKCKQDGIIFPTTKKFVFEIENILVSKNSDEIFSKDEWGHDLLFFYDGKNFGIASIGKDGNFSGWEQRGLFDCDSMEGFDNDVILINGEFVHFPDVRPERKKNLKSL